MYQRKQFEKLSQESLKLAKQLQRKLNEIRDRSGRYPMPLEVVPALNLVLEGLDEQLESLAQSQVSQSSENEIEEE